MIAMIPGESILTFNGIYRGYTREKFQHKRVIDEFYKAGVTWLFNHGQVVEVGLLP